jgi:hypothetical protein
MNRQDLTRDYFMLTGPLAKNGYDWWWHNFTAYHRETGKERTFFIEYYVCNPALGGDSAILGQLPQNKANGVKPSYALIKAGTWGTNACQLHNFYPINQFSCPHDQLQVKTGACTLTETQMKGSCKVIAEEAANHPEYMCDAGEMNWDIQMDKKIAFHVGYGASRFFRTMNSFEMFWHAQGIKTEYSGQLTFNGEIYDVIPEKSYGYADKNWGQDFTSPWLWISSCNMKSLISGKRLKNSAVEFGGGRPKAFGIDLGKKLLGCFYYEGENYEYNFSKFWTKSQIRFQFTEKGEINVWKVKAQNRESVLELTLKCLKDEMLLVNYEAPNGTKRHNRLWNGGTGYGEIKLYKKNGHERILLDHVAIRSAGCEYGEYTE